MSKKGIPRIGAKFVCSVPEGFTVRSFRHCMIAVSLDHPPKIFNNNTGTWDDLVATCAEPVKIYQTNLHIGERG